MKSGDKIHKMRPEIHLQSWDLKKTYDLVEKLFGRVQLSIVQPSIRSIGDRQKFAQYHYVETKRLLRGFQRRHLRNRHLFEAIHGSDEKASYAFEVLMVKVGAHITACIQAIHAVPDILASGVYLGLGLNLKSEKLADRSINITSVGNLLRRFPSYIELATLFDQVALGYKYEYIAAVSNLSKHRTVIRPSLNMDMTGVRTNLHEFHIGSFEKKIGGILKYYPSISIEDLLEEEFSRVGGIIVEIGNKMNEILESGDHMHAI